MALGSSKLVKAPAPSFTDANTDLKNVSMPSPRAAMCFCAATSQQPVPYSNIAVAVDFLFASWPQVNRHRHGQSASQASPWLPALPPHPSPARGPPLPILRKASAMQMQSRQRALASRGSGGSPAGRAASACWGMGRCRFAERPTASPFANRGRSLEPSSDILAPRSLAPASGRCADDCRLRERRSSRA